VWIVNEGPRGGDSAATNTWALGASAGRDQDVRWKVTAVEPGTYTLQLPHLPGLTARRSSPSGGRTDGSFKVTIDDKPVPRASTTTGNVVRGEAPARRR
jgi:hypothetical protein